MGNNCAIEMRIPSSPTLSTEREAERTTGYATRWKENFIELSEDMHRRILPPLHLSVTGRNSPRGNLLESA